jgi:hypothetical protein
METLLELTLIGLLAATLFHAMRLERLLGALKRDRAALEQTIAGFAASTQQAEAGLDRLRGVADGAGRQIARQLDEARALRDDLTFLMERGGRLADRMDTLVRAGRPIAGDQSAPRPRPLTAEPEAEEPPLRSQAERDLLKALRMAR